MITTKRVLETSAILFICSVSCSAVFAQSPSVKIYERGNQRCIESNGVPNHQIGQFPNSGNPNRFRTQQLKFCFDKTPRKNANPTRGTPNVGIALNGIVIRPGTADWYDASTRRGFSRNRASGWNLEGMGSAESLGIDENNAHVDNRGLYHYHGKPVGLLKVSKSTLVGYAADGFEIHYVGKDAKPSYVLKSGTRPTAPGGAYDGRFVQDWKYAKGAGNLDECNGGIIDGKFVYFATDSYPFYPRCHWGNVSQDFERRGPRNGDRRDRRAGRGPLVGAAAELGVSVSELRDAVGPPPPNVEQAAKKLGIPAARIRRALRNNRP